MGGWSRGYPQKSLSVYARRNLGASEFDYRLFPDREFQSYQAFVLRNSGNDWISTMLRDGYLQELVRDTEIDRMAFRPAVLYLNGEYWGIHNLREKINEHYVASIGGIPADEVDMLAGETDVEFHVLQGEIDSYIALKDLIENGDVRSAEVYEQIQSMMDIDNFIDYQLAQIYFDNRDWPGNNVKIWRHRAVGGRWRWILYDTDFGFGIWNPSDYAYNTLAFATEPGGPSWPNPPWSTLFLRRLLENETFRNAFANRYADLLNVHFTQERLGAVLDSLSGLIAGEMPRHVARWGRSVAEWNDAINSMRVFGANRETYMTGHVRSYLGLSQQITLSVLAQPESGGSVRVNRETVKTNPWSGRYFPGVPLPVTAIPAPGYRFAGWTGDVVGSDPSLTLTLTRATSLRARFQPDTSVAVAINEIHYHPSDDMASGDWVELVNPSDAAVDVSGWVLEDGGGNRFVVPATVHVEAGGYLVLAEDLTAFNEVHPDVADVVGGWTFGLSSGGEAVRLLNAAGTAVDEVVFGVVDPWPVEADGNGSSLELISTDQDNALAGSWAASSVRGGTPGARNSTFVSVESTGDVPTMYAMNAVYPNPFRSVAILPFSLPEPGHVTVRVFNTLGQHVATLEDALLTAGRHETVWRPGTAASGLYVAQLTVNGVRRAQTTLLKIR